MASTMDFFGYQEQARKKTGVLVFYYALAVILIVIAVYLAVAGVYAGAVMRSGSDERSGFSAADLWHGRLFLGVAGATLLVVVLGTAYKIRQMSAGGEAVAKMLGGRPIDANTRDPNERKILNVVEEMAIASGTPVPRVFLLEQEESINAFAAGFTPATAVIGVTRGCIEQLTRDELQGVIAHEFSHILNGDMRLNIRLIGVLNGILVIGIIGYWIMRTSLHSGGRTRSNKKGGNPLPLALMGILIMIVGYIGVFFGKLIKSAVSRQREYLADASAVQFTRNPLGIGNALRKIGGYVRGSRLESSNAEHASHLFFSNGIAATFLGLMATHPPLTERIKRIDPSFTGDFSRGLPAPAGSGGGQAKPPAEGVSQFSVTSEEVMAGVGAPTAAHLSHASAVLASMPARLAEEIRGIPGALAVVFRSLLSEDKDVRASQMEYLNKAADVSVVEKMNALEPELGSLAEEYRLPLLELAVSTLRSMSRDRYAAFEEAVSRLVGADKQVDLAEFTLKRMIMRHLEPSFRKVPRRPVRYHDVRPVMAECVNLLSCLAYWGADDIETARAAFARGMSRLAGGAAPGMIAVEKCGLATVEQALDRIAEASPPAKKLVLDACVSCVGSDGRVTMEEADLIRVVADSFDCPIPPFFSAVRKATDSHPAEY